MVDLGLDGGVVVLEPLGDPAGLGRRGTLALDEGEDLVGVGEQVVEQTFRSPRGGGGDRSDAVTADTEVVALGGRRLKPGPPG